MNFYFIIYKPYGVLSQFSSALNKQTLKDFFDVPEDVYAIGRLDEDSEGLLILSNDKILNNKLLHPSFEHAREYLVQVDGVMNEHAIMLLQQGLEINIRGKLYSTKKCFAELLKEHPEVAERNPPIRVRKNIPTSWIKIRLTEGKNRQVRKMCAKAGFPVLRLIRIAIEDIQLGKLQPAEMIQLSKNVVYKKLFKQE